ncbi:glycosyl hydrolase family 28-related protein [Niveispirillum sp. BGYR6]|uniref:glycosyl hydrolase family 28-related protein n=1 Tax=Niveispirillum sp. BGYR6 TaxID=2971249 RepID=UPI0022B96EA6|nr:glycosyl hydrolase family 28-related protein [Niveispirillum sp. BGYR6]MDG5495961.1 glycosyl hydrolase family 28-related protein [Niveispirillum sp. BGYR6]
MTTDTIPVPAVSPRVHYLADGVASRFAFAFPVYAAADLTLHLDDAPVTMGYSLDGLGEPAGGAVTFATPPAAGSRITIQRRVSLDRQSDFLESGAISARSLNAQLNRLTAMVQQLAADQDKMLKLAATDLPASPLLPGREVRAGKALGFDEAGNPVALGLDALPTTAQASAHGAGAVARPVADKLRDLVSVRDFGAVGDGVADDTGAILAALAAHRSVFLPAGTYRTSATITLGYGQTLYGEGEGSVIQARASAYDPVNLPEYPSQFNAVEMVDGYAALRNLRIVGGASGVKIYGRDGPAVKNVVENISIWDSLIGLVLDGYDDTNRPCYWNHIARVLVARPALHGVLLTVEGDGDTPNANKFQDVRVYSLSAPMTGCGFFVSAGRFNNAFTDCEANLHPGAEACMRLGAATDQNLIVNFYAESLGALPGIRIDNGSQNSGIVNLFSATAGQPIWDPTGKRAYTAVNAGYPLRNLLKETHITDLRVEGFSVDTNYVEPQAGGLVEAELTSTSHLVSAFGGEVEFRLPAAGTANGRMLTIKKTDASAHPVRVTELGGPGPDGRPVVLASRYDSVSVISNGANWWVTGGTAQPGNAEFRDQAGLFEPDLAKALYLISGADGDVEVRLPSPSASHAVGRSLTIKKSDDSTGVVTVTAASGTGPDGRVWRLGKRYDYVRVFSNGAGWWVTAASRSPAPLHFHEAAGLFQPDLGAAFYLVSAYAGPVEVRLPAPSAGNSGIAVTIKKTDPGSHPVTISSGDGTTGPDGGRVTLAAQYDGVVALSNGAAWHLVGRCR